MSPAGNLETQAEDLSESEVDQRNGPLNDRTALGTRSAQTQVAATATYASRASAIEQVMRATAGEKPAVKRAALAALLDQVPPPTTWGTNIVWIVFVGGLVLILALAVLGLTHVLGTGVTDDKLVTIFTTVLAGLLGLFAQKPGT